MFDDFENLKEKKLKCFEIPKYVITEAAEVMRWKYNISVIVDSPTSGFDYTRLTELALDKNFRKKMNINLN